MERIDFCFNCVDKKEEFGEDGTTTNTLGTVLEVVILVPSSTIFELRYMLRILFVVFMLCYVLSQRQCFQYCITVFGR